LATYARTGDLKAVVDQLIRETAEGVTEPNLGPPLVPANATGTTAAFDQEQLQRAAATRAQSMP
jgi:carboxylate-amine ligase